MLDSLTVAAAHHPAAAGIAAGVGLLIGSFLNVVIHRVPIMMQRDLDNDLACASGRSLPHSDRYDLVAPRSACPHCHATINAAHNFPVLGYLLLQGRCKQCRQAISWRYPAVEIISALVSAWLVWHFGAGLTALAALAFAYYLIALAFIDAHTQLLPDNLTLPLLWLGLLVNLGGLFAPLTDAVAGAAAGYLVLWVIYWTYRLATGKHGLGYGDFKLMAALGAWLGWQVLTPLLLLASCLGALVGVTLIACGRQASDQTMPFGPYLAFAGILMLLYGKPTLSFALY